jgi:hypothetical protein
LIRERAPQTATAPKVTEASSAELLLGLVASLRTAGNLRRYAKL